MLTDFFRINMPYGMSRNDEGKWMFFNREYLPLGWNSWFTYDGEKRAKEPFDEIPIYTKYKALSNSRLTKLAYDEDAVRYDKNGDINKVFFYNDRMNPMNDSSYWPEYLNRIKLLSKLSVKIEYPVRRSAMI